MTRISSLSALAAATSQEVATSTDRINAKQRSVMTNMTNFLSGLSLDTMVNSSVSSEVASKEYYRNMMTRYRKNRSGRLTRVGKMAFEALQTLRPSVSRVLEQPYLDDTEMGVITGRTILSLVKEGSQRRPGCVLTSHYLIDMLSGQTSTSTEEKMCFLNFHDATKSMTHRAIYDLTKAGLIEIETRDNTQLLTPYSERDAGQENLYDWLMTRYKQNNEPVSESIRDAFHDEINKVDKNRYLMDVCYFTDSQFGNITGWDLLSLLVESQLQMLGNIPAEAITNFFDIEKKAAVMNGIDDLSKKMNLLEIHPASDAPDECYYEVKPFAAMVLPLRLKEVRQPVGMAQQLKSIGNIKNFLV